MDAGKKISLVLGGARSGKSAYAEGLIVNGSMHAVYIATASKNEDAEMLERIEAHQARRDSKRWQLVEEPLELPDVLTRLGKGAHPILIDCLPLWLSNLLKEERDPHPAIEQFLEALKASAVSVVCVSGEVGLGMTPLNPVGRAFRDHLGMLNQKTAAIANDVTFMLSGIPMKVKG
ncbi:MAG: bifunctional adenosylcobinamide kinase/adenosylcobinamide-phosphate guanylyltransferase [Hyphomicrobiales bacterium]|nr:bifunctional adenosylcobinamide kinase/adenosylcobinamide-phosphate guanylyltransferase [Hyphomicrobiales bacterium]